jgi:hypothetical protein
MVPAGATQSQPSTAKQRPNQRGGMGGAKQSPLQIPIMATILISLWRNRRPAAVGAKLSQTPTPATDHRHHHQN